MPQSPPQLPDSAAPETTDLGRELAVCRKLRTKLAFTPLCTSEGEPLLWQKGDGSTSVYWCCATMECAGPDGGLVHATLCRDDRLCHQRRD